MPRENEIDSCCFSPDDGLGSGELHFGLVYDPEMLDSAWELAEAIPKQLIALQAAVDREIATASEGA